MTTHPIDRTVIGCLTGGRVVALGLVLGPVPGAQEHAITGTVLIVTSVMAPGATPQQVRIVQPPNPVT